MFEVADAILSERSGWRTELSTFEDESSVNVALGQSRSFIRVRDGFSDGMHPYVVKKLGSARIFSPEKRMMDLLHAFIASRSGLSSGNEVEGLI